MNMPDNVWKNERGSALLLILIGVVVTGIIFGSLYLSLEYSQKLTLSEELRVQAEYDAQKMMDVGLSYYYQGTEAFDAKFSVKPPCITEGGASVCLQIAADNSRTLVATGTRTRDAAQWHGNETREIRYTLDTAGPVTPDPGNTNPKPPDPPPVQPPPEPVTGPVSQGQTCKQMASSGIPLKALVLGEKFDTSLARRDNKSPTVVIEGGVYIGKSNLLILPQEANHKNIEINGYTYPEGGLDWDRGKNKDPQYDDLGSRAIIDNCTPLSDFHGDLNKLAGYYYGSVQPFDVYHFSGSRVTTTSTGCKQALGFTNCLNSSETLASVLAKTTAKVVLIEGNVELPQTMNSSGYLIVYGGTKSAASTIYLPNGFNWTHTGAVATEQVRTTPTSGVWPDQYELYITLRQAQADLYKRTR
jgi:hypothetical protein